jgi:hypothetical protein
MIKEISSPKLKNPVFIAAWPGMGEVAYRSALFLKEVLSFKVFAKLEAEQFFKPAAVVVEKGILDIPTAPAGFFYYYKGKNSPDIILFLGEVQPPLEYAEAFSLHIVNFVKKYKAKTICTFAAKPEPIDHRSESKIWAAATSSNLLAELEKMDAKTLPSGQISGLNGIILGVGKKKKISGFCLLGEIPFYMVQIENPKATAGILQILSKYFKLNLNIDSIIQRSKFIEEEIDKLISYLKGESPQPGPSPLSEEDIEKIKKDLATYTKLPQSAREKIEDLFKKAQKDIGVANQLKGELDHWNVYKEYEDKFLGLFKKRPRRNESH